MIKFIREYKSGFWVIDVYLFKLKLIFKKFIDFY